MSVPAFRRTESKVEFLNNLDRIRRDSYLILMRDFGIKKKEYTINLLEKIYEISEEDKVSLEALMNKYGISTADVDKYPSWLIEIWRRDVSNIITKIGIEVRVFNSIYIINKSLKIAEQAYLARRGHINMSIGYLQALKDKFQEIIMIIDVSIGAYNNVCKEIDYEIKLLKGVRQSDNNLFEKIKASFEKHH